MMGTSEDLNRKQGACVTFTFPSFGLLLLAIMSAVSAARPHRVQHPTFLNTSTNITAVEGEDVILPCAVIGRGTKIVVWKKVHHNTALTIGDYIFDGDANLRVHHGEVATSPETSGHQNIGRSHPNDGHGKGYGNRDGTSGKDTFRHNRDSVRTHHKSTTKKSPRNYYHQDYGHPYDQNGKGLEDVHGGTGVYGNRYDHNLSEMSNYDNPYWNLEILGVTPEHAGIYECQVTTAGDYSRNVTLHVTGEGAALHRSHHHHGGGGSSGGADPNSKKKKTGIKLSGSHYVEKGNTIDLNCTATAIDYRPKGVDWFKDGSKIKSAPGVLTTDWIMSETNVLHSRLQIERATMDDAGTYVCRFSAKYVESIKVIVLNTDSPKNPRETASDGLRESKSQKDDPDDAATQNGIHPFHTILAVLLTLAVAAWT